MKMTMQGRISQVAWLAIWVAIQGSTWFCRAAEGELHADEGNCRLETFCEF
jgi:hypothetical protein